MVPLCAHAKLHFSLLLASHRAPQYRSLFSLFNVTINGLYLGHEVACERLVHCTSSFLVVVCLSLARSRTVEGLKIRVNER